MNYNYPANKKVSIIKYKGYEYLYRPSSNVGVYSYYKAQIRGNRRVHMIRIRASEVILLLMKLLNEKEVKTIS